MAGIAAQLFLYERKEVYIINSSLHSVLYDGKDTWDFDLGFVLRDYKYPSKKLPEIEDIPLFLDLEFFQILLKNILKITI